MIEKHQPLLSLPPTLGPGIINRESWRLDGNANTSGYLRLGISASGVGDWLGGGRRKIHLIRQRKGWHFVKLASSVLSSAPRGFYCHLWATLYDSFLGTDRKGHTINLHCRLQLLKHTFSLESNDPIRFSTWVWEIKLQQRHKVQMKEWKKLNFLEA